MGRVIQVRFTAQDTKAIEAAAKGSKATVSDWVRNANQAILASAELMEQTRKLIQQSKEGLKHRPIIK